MSCPEAVPSQKKGIRIASEVTKDTAVALAHARGPSTFQLASEPGASPLIAGGSLLQLIRQKDDLAHMMIRMSRGAKKNIETLFRFRLAVRGVFFHPVVGRLLANRFDNHRNRFVESRKHFILWSRLWFGEFPVAIAHITRRRYACADVIVQISRQMKNQVTDTVAVGIRLSPQLFRRQTSRPLVNTVVHHFVISGEILCDYFCQSSHCPDRLHSKSHFAAGSFL